MLNLEILLKKTIKQFNAITIKDFLTLILHHEQLGYYRKKSIRSYGRTKKGKI